MVGQWIFYLTQSLVGVAWMVFLLSCISEYENQINTDKTGRELTPAPGQLDFEKINLSNGLLITDDTLVLFKNDTASNSSVWIDDTLAASEWTEKRGAD